MNKKKVQPQIHSKGEEIRVIRDSCNYNELGRHVLGTCKKTTNQLQINWAQNLCQREAATKVINWGAFQFSPDRKPKLSSELYPCALPTDLWLCFVCGSSWHMLLTRGSKVYLLMHHNRRVAKPTSNFWLRCSAETFSAKFKASLVVFSLTDKEENDGLRLQPTERQGRKRCTPSNNGQSFALWILFFFKVEDFIISRSLCLSVWSRT